MERSLFLGTTALGGNIVERTLPPRKPTHPRRVGLLAAPEWQAIIVSRNCGRYHVAELSLTGIAGMLPMTRIVAAAVLACAAMPVICAPLPAQDLRNSQVEIVYVEPKDSALRPIYERLKKRGVLEDLQQFLSPLNLPRKLTVKLDQCGSATVRFKPQGPVTVCYEYLEEVERLAYGPLRHDMVAGAFVQELLHEVARGLFDILQVPVWGRVSDAADNLAAFIMLQFGKDVALRTVRGTHLFFGAIAIFGADTSPADVRSTAAQRNYNTICIAYGGDPDTFGYLVDVDDRFSPLPMSRRRLCRLEFEAVRKAFDHYIRRHVDEAKLAKVRSMDWLRPDDGRLP